MEVCETLEVLATCPALRVQWRASRGGHHGVLDPSHGPYTTRSRLASWPKNPHMIRTCMGVAPEDGMNTRPGNAAEKSVPRSPYPGVTPRSSALESENGPQSNSPGKKAPRLTPSAMARIPRSRITQSRMSSISSCVLGPERVSSATSCGVRGKSG